MTKVTYLYNTNAHSKYQDWSKVVQEPLPGLLITWLENKNTDGESQGNLKSNVGVNLVHFSFLRKNCLFLLSFYSWEILLVHVTCFDRAGFPPLPLYHQVFMQRCVCVCPVCLSIIILRYKASMETNRELFFYET